MSDRAVAPARPAVVLVSLMITIAACGGGGSKPQGRQSTPAAGTTSPSSNASVPGATSTPTGPGGSKTNGPAPVPTSGSAAKAKVPAQGAYIYDQTGSEKFCTTKCTTKQLPPTRSMTVSVVASDAGSITITSSGQVSEMRFTRDTIRFTPARAFLTETYVRFTSGSFQFEDSYKPNPPIEVLRFPLTVGASWTGSWQADTYGTYSAQVAAREPIAVAGKTVQAFRVTVHTAFTGDVDGTQDVTVWIDPATNATVRQSGSISAKTFLGRYETTFDAVLRSAPGY